MSCACSSMQFVEESGCAHLSDEVQDFVRREVEKPSKGWVDDVIRCRREGEHVKLRTDKFVLLPDINTCKRQPRVCCCRQTWSDGESWGLPRWATTRPFEGPCWGACDREAASKSTPLAGHDQGALRGFNWLAICTDEGVRSLRDLRGWHAAMLEDLFDKCCECIKGHLGYERHQIMAYVNYPPSVYRLHIHFCAPFSGSSAFDAFRMHPLSTIINNLRLCGDYYRLASLCVPVHSNSELCRALSRARHGESRESLV